MSFIFIAAATIHGDLRAQENKTCHCFYFVRSICHEVMGPDDIQMFFECWKASFSTFLFNPNQEAV